MDLLLAVGGVGARHQGLAPVRELLRARVSASTLSRAVRDGRLVRVGRGVLSRTPVPPLPRYLGTDLGPDPVWVLQVRAALLARPGSVATGRTAATLRGWPLLCEPREPELAVAHGSRRRAAGTTAGQVRDLRVEDLVVLPGTAPLRLERSVDTVLDAATRLPLAEAVALVDGALRSGAVDLAELDDAAARRPGTREAERARRVLRWCDPASGSVLESVARVLLLSAGVDGFQTQRVLRDGRGRHVLRADLCFERARLVVELDGSRWHPEPARDRRTDNALGALGWRVLRYGWADVVHDGAAVVAQVQRALAEVAA